MELEARAKVVAYVRVSTKDQEEYSPETQRNYLSEYADAVSLEIVEWFQETHSAYELGRPVFDRMCEYLDAHPQVEGVLVYRIDRLTRNLADFARLMGRVGLRIISATEALPDNPTGRMVAGIQAVVATNFSEQLSERVRHGLLTKAKRGLFPGRAGDGYLNKDGVLVQDTERAPMVREFFDVVEHPEMTLSGLAEYAGGRGFRTRRGKRFVPSSLRYMLTNPLYYGDFEWNGQLYRGVHEPIVTKAQFDRVQEKLARKSQSYGEEVFAYRGLLTCHECGCSITAELKKSRYIYYRCTAGRGDCRVKHKYVNQDTMAGRLASVVESVRLSREQVGFLVGAAKRQAGTDRQGTRLEIRRLETTLEQIKDERIQAYTDKLRGAIQEGFWNEVSRTYLARERLVEERITHLRSRQNSQLTDPEPALELLEAAPRLYERGSHSQKARILDALVSNCAVDTENVYPNYREPFAAVAQYNEDAVVSGGLTVELKYWPHRGDLGPVYRAGESRVL